MPHDSIVCLSTAPDSALAEKLARVLVEEQLAACVNILPGVRSIYRWQGKIEDTAEVMLVIKSRRHLLDALVGRVRALHSYSVPEVVAFDVVGGNPDYLTWIADSTWGPR
jgi:periplasmic divalent cation tolerance protein